MTRGKLILRNVVGFVVMVAACGAGFAVLLYALAPFELLGFRRLIIASAAASSYGVLGHFVFAGDGSFRTFLTFP